MAAAEKTDGKGAPGEGKTGAIDPLDVPLFKSTLTYRQLLELDDKALSETLSEAAFKSKTIPFGDTAMIRARLAIIRAEQNEAATASSRSPLDGLMPAALVGAGGAGAIGLYIADKVKEIINGTETQFNAQINAGSVLDQLRAKLDENRYRIEDREGRGNSVTFDIYDDGEGSKYQTKPLLKILISEKNIAETVVNLKDSYVPGGKAKKSERTVSSVKVSGLDEDVLKGQMTGILQSGISFLEALTSEHGSAGDEFAELIEDGQNAAETASVMKTVLAIIAEEAKSAEEARALYIQTTGNENETYLTQLKTSTTCEFCPTDRTQEPEAHACPSCGAQIEKAVYQGDDLTDRRQAAGL